MIKVAPDQSHRQGISLRRDHLDEGCQAVGLQQLHPGERPHNLPEAVGPQVRRELDHQLVELEADRQGQGLIRNGHQAPC